MVLSCSSLFHCLIPCPAPSSNAAMMSLSSVLHILFNFLLDFVSTMITVASTVFFTFQEHSNMSSKQNDVYIVNYSCFLPEAISICSYVLWDFPSTLSLDCPSSSTKMGNAKIQMRLYMNKGPRALVLSYKSSYYLLLELLWDPLLHYHTSWCLLSKPHCFLRSNNF